LWILSILDHSCLYAFCWRVRTWKHILLHTFERARLVNLLSIEALDSMVANSAVGFGVLDESWHGLSAVSVEVGVVLVHFLIESSFYFFQRWFQRVHGHLWLDIVPEISNEFKSIIKSNYHRLIVVRRPVTSYFLGVLGIHLLSLDLVAIQKLNLPHKFLIKLKFVVSVNNLEFIWDVVRAHLFRFEKVHKLNLLGHVEVPGSNDVICYTVDWLVCS
jgi:hypothetical protein